MVKILWTVLRAICMGIVGYMAPRLLVGSGVPIDEYAAFVGKMVGIAVTSETALFAVAIISSLVLAGIEVWIRPIARFWGSAFGSADKLQSQTKVNATPDRMPLVDFFAAAEKCGWRFREPPPSLIIKFVSILRQAGVDEVIQFWGRPAKQHIFNELIRAEPLQKIDSRHWLEYHIEWLPVVRMRPRTTEIESLDDSLDNFETLTNKPMDGKGFHDIHVEKGAALSWLTLNSPPTDIAISLRDAAIQAYDICKGSSAAMMAETDAKGDPNRVLDWFATALVNRDDGIDVFGMKPPSQYVERIPRDQLTSHFFDEGAQKLRPNANNGIAFENLLVINQDAENRSRIIKEW